MKHSLKTRVLALLLALVLVLGMTPMAVLAAEGEQNTETSVALQSTVTPLAVANGDYDTSVSNNYFNVISANTYNLAPGAIEKEIILNNAEGNDRKAVHVIEVENDVSSIHVLPGYYQIDKLDAENLADGTYWETAGLSKTVAYYEETLGYNVVGAMNTALAYDSDAPYGFMVYNGVVLGSPDIHKGAQTYLAVVKNSDGTVEFDLRSMSEPLTGNEWQAVSANFGWLVQDGALTTTKVERDSSDASRSMLGIKADGTLVICQVDGRNAPVSSGLSNYEMGEAMLALGCVWAVNGDGGGSSTFITKREGTSNNVMRSNPSDGYERPTINSIIVVSTAVADGTFDHAVLDSDVEYVTPGSEVTFTADGVDAGGGVAEIPADVTWKMADDSMGTVSNGVFTSSGKVGTAVVQLVHADQVVGQGSVEVVNPTAISFTQASYIVPFGKSVNLDVKATINDGLIEVTSKASDFVITIDQEAVGTLNGKLFTAVTEAGEVTSATVTATYTHDNLSISTTAPLKLGKGSEVVEDYESYQLGERIYDYANAHSYGSGDSYVEVVDASTGKVRNGNKALAIHVDGTEYRYYGTFSQNRIQDLGIHGISEATALGMWIYVPEEAVGLHLAIRSRKPGETKSAFTLYLTGNQEYTGTLELPGWHYMSVDLSAVNYEFDLYSFELFMYETDGGNYAEVDLTQEYNLLGKYTLYVDDITVDYSSAVEDREIPEFDDIYISNDDAGVAMKGQTITNNIVGVYTMASDAKKDNAVGLDISTAKAYVDGVRVTDGFTCSTNGMLSLADVTLCEGAHTFRFEIADANGNTASIQRHVVVNASDADAPVSIVPQDPAATNLLIGSNYWIDVKAAETEKIQKIVTTIELDGVHDWVFDGMKVAEGFSAEYILDASTNDVTLTITKTGTVDVTGESTLVSIPIHTWEYEEYYNNKTLIDPAVTQIDFGVQNSWLKAVKLRADYGVVTYEDNSTDTFAMAPLTVVSEINVDSKAADGGWHIHKTEAVEDKKASCTESGYTGRTVCVGCLCGQETHKTGIACPESGCGSVVDWGTLIPATGHTYEIIDDVLKCACGELFNGVHTDGKTYVDGVVIADGWVEDSYYANGVKVTGIYAVEDVYYDFGEDGVNQGKVNGLFALDGKIYIAIAGKLVTGWQMADDGWCYADPTSKEVKTGEFTVSGRTYTADETGVVVKGAWVTDAKGTKYSYGPAFYVRSWQEIDGATYYFGTDYYIYTGTRSIPLNRNNLKEGVQWHYFAEDGKYLGEATDLNGIVDENGKRYWVENGWNVYGGLMKIDGDYYYARSTGEIVCGKTYWITKDNGLLPAAGYTFDADGKMVNPPVDEPENPSEPSDPTEPTLKNGIVEENGKKYYYVDGVKTYGGLMKIDGDYYYARSSGEIVCGKTYWITKNNDLLPVAGYAFDADGKMVNPPVDEPENPTEPSNPDEPSTPTEPTLKNGIVEEGGKKYYYVDGVKTYGGLMKIDGDYYYARSSGEIVCGKTYWITKNNDLLPVAGYTFDADGKMVNPPVDEPENPTEPSNPDEPSTPTEPTLKNGIVEEDGKKYYYVDGVKTYGGLLKIDGDYYYARTSGEIVCGKTYWITKNNDLLPVAGYTFDADGKMVNPPAAE